jgi:hypothetical protein
MRKYITLAAMLTLLGNNFAHAAPYRSRPIQKNNKRTAADTLKYGVVWTGSIMGGREIGGFVEYKINSPFGIETGLRFVGSVYGLIKSEINSSDAVVVARSLTIPLIARFYPGSDRKFAWYIGLQGGYILGGRVVLLPSNLKELKFNNIASLEERDLSSFPPEKVASWQAALAAGLDYETDHGFIWGFKYTQEMIPLIPSKEMLWAWHLMLSLGANIGAWF